MAHEDYVHVSAICDVTHCGLSNRVMVFNICLRYKSAWITIYLQSQHKMIHFASGKNSQINQ